jgi:serine/threonine protein kinase
MHLSTDVKAANILLKKSDNARGYTAKLADFGVSRMMTEAQSHITVQGQLDPWEHAIVGSSSGQLGLPGLKMQPPMHPTNQLTNQLNRIKMAACHGVTDHCP